MLELQLLSSLHEFTDSFLRNLRFSEIQKLKNTLQFLILDTLQVEDGVKRVGVDEEQLPEDGAAGAKDDSVSRELFEIITDQCYIIEMNLAPECLEIVPKHCRIVQICGMHPHL